MSTSAKTSKVMSKNKKALPPFMMLLEFSNTGATKLQADTANFVTLAEEKSNNGAYMKDVIRKIGDVNKEKRDVLLFTSERIPALNRDCSTDLGWGMVLGYPLHVIEVPKDEEFNLLFCSSVWGGVENSKSLGTRNNSGKYRAHFVSRVNGKSWAMHMDYLSYLTADRRKSKVRLARSLAMNFTAREMKTTSELKAKWAADPDFSDLMGLHEKLSKLTLYHPQISIPINDSQQLTFNNYWVGESAQNTRALSQQQQELKKDDAKEAVKEARVELSKVEEELVSIGTYANALSRFVEYWTKQS
jgi:hypothetical protein